MSNHHAYKRLLRLIDGNKVRLILPADKKLVKEVIDVIDNYVNQPHTMTISDLLDNDVASIEYELADFEATGRALDKFSFIYSDGSTIAFDYTYTRELGAPLPHTHKF